MYPERYQNDVVGPLDELDNINFLYYWRVTKKEKQPLTRTTNASNYFIQPTTARNKINIYVYIYVYKLLVLTICSTGLREYLLSRTSPQPFLINSFPA